MILWRGGIIFLYFLRFSNAVVFITSISKMIEIDVEEFEADNFLYDLKFESIEHY